MWGSCSYKKKSVYIFETVCKTIDGKIYLLTLGAFERNHSWKKIMQLLWVVVTCLVKNVKRGIEHDIDSAYGDIRHSRNLQQIW